MALNAYIQSHYIDIIQLYIPWPIRPPKFRDRAKEGRGLFLSLPQLFCHKECDVNHLRGWHIYWHQGALRSMQGICTSPQIGSQVMPR